MQHNFSVSFSVTVQGNFIEVLAIVKQKQESIMALLGVVQGDDIIISSKMGPLWQLILARRPILAVSIG